MSFPFGVLCLLIILRILNVTAFPQVPSNNPPALPTYVTTSLPVCARPCIQNFIAESFPTSICPDQADLNCLCTQESYTGYTLGEGALACVASSCPENNTIIASAYEICTGQRGALQNTHETITATIAASTASSFTSDAEILTAQASSQSGPQPAQANFSSSSGSIISTSTSVSTSTMASASSSVIPLGSLLTASGTPSISIAPTFQSTRATLTPLTAQTTTQVPVSPQSSTISPVAARSGSLSSPQIAGIAVSGVAAASLAMGLILFVGCLRRRRKVRQADDPPFEIEKTPPKPLTLPNCSSAAMTDPRLRDAASNTATIDFAARERAAPPVPPKTEPHRWSLWPRPSVKPHDIGVAISPEMTQAASPTSVASYRTVSKLLPDKPGLAFVPTSFQKSSSRESRRPESAVTEFEDDEDDMGKRSLDVITDLYAGHWPVERDLTPSPQPIGQTVEEPTKVEIVAKPKQAQRPQPAIRVPTALTAGGKLRNSVYLPPRMGDSSIYTDRSSLPPSEPRNSQYPSSNIPVANRRRSQKKAARYSNASDTSFETLGDDEDADTDHEGLSPVAESPIADVRYPKIPRSASSAQRPERQPSFSTKPVHPSITTPSTHLGARNANLPSASHSSQHDRSLKKGQTPSASSLLAKRRGDRAAAELEMRLKTRRDEEGARQYAARTGTDLDDFIKSPTARELTPTRRGDELFLAVR